MCDSGTLHHSFRSALRSHCPCLWCVAAAMSLFAMHLIMAQFEYRLHTRPTSSLVQSFSSRSWPLILTVALISNVVTTTIWSTLYIYIFMDCDSVPKFFAYRAASEPGDSHRKWAYFAEIAEELQRQNQDHWTCTSPQRLLYGPTNAKSLRSRLQSLSQSQSNPWFSGVDKRIHKPQSTHGIKLPSFSHWIRRPASVCTSFAGT